MGRELLEKKGAGRDQARQRVLAMKAKRLRFGDRWSNGGLFGHARAEYTRILHAMRLPVAALTLVASLGFAAACARSAKHADPVAALARTPQAAAEIGQLHEAWEGRHLERTRVEAFLVRYPTDPTAVCAKIYLAFSLMDEGQLAGADSILGTIDAPPGATHDLAMIAEARSFRLHGAPRSALDRLRPLVGKVIDDADREIFLEELALAALAAHDDYEALAYLDAWLRGVGEDGKDRVRAKIQQILDTLPRDVLERTYRSMRANSNGSGYGPDTQKLVSERLARIAVETNDAALARWLVDVSGVSAAQAGGDAGLELGDLAASRRGISTVKGKTVGLLLPTRDRELRDEAADVVRGISWALGLPRTASTDGQDPGVRLVTRDDGADAAASRTALEELAGEGATVIVGGFDRASADRAAAWSEASGIPVLLLATPSVVRMPKKTAVVLGEPIEHEIALLGEALVKRGVTTAAFVVDTADDEAAASAIDARSALNLLPAVKCDVPMSEAGKTRFPIDSWWRGGARGWIVSGASVCARDLLRDVSATHKAAVVALTLEASVPPVEMPRGIVVLGAAAGIVPVVEAKPEDVKDPDVRNFMGRFGVRPSYWTALGHDAGVLAKGALASLGRDATTDPKIVTQRREVVQAGLLATRATLWTSDMQNLGQNRVLARTLRIVTTEGTK